MEQTRFPRSSRKQSSFISRRICVLLVYLPFFAVFLGCPPPGPQDPHVVKDGRELPDNPKVLSPPIVQQPLYDCGSNVVVQGFVPGALIKVFANGTPIGGGTSNAPWGQSFGVAPALTAGQVITATQSANGATSNPSQPVTVRSHAQDFPSGFPTPFLDPTPSFKCGQAIGVRNVVPGALLQVSSEPPTGPGTFGPPTTVGQVNGSGAAQAVDVSPPFIEGARITAKYSLCADTSPPTSPQIVQPDPVIPAPTIDNNVYDGATVITVRNVVNGAVIDVTANGVHVGGQPSVGGSQLVAISPPASQGQALVANQALCSKGPDSPGIVVQPCSQFPTAQISPPQVGDTVIHVTQFVLGSRILIYAGTEEIGNGGGSLIQLTRPLMAGEQVKVVQKLGTCTSSWMYVINVECKAPPVMNDPSGSGPYFVGAVDYQLPAIQIGADSVRLWATVRYPAMAGGNNTDLIPSPTKLPLVALLHGNHGIFRKDNTDYCVDPGGSMPTPNHEGYNYVLESLAKNGIIAISINANDLNCLPDRIPERAQLVLAHLELWKKFNDPGQPDPVFNGKFYNHVDLSRIGIGGHSRGGEAVVGAAIMNPDTQLNIRAVVSVAPTDAHDWTLPDTPLLMILGAADGDVWDNEGARIYDRAQAKSFDGWHKSQMYIYGANHNFFNREWLNDEGMGPNRMTRPGQETMLRAWARGFYDLNLQATELYRPIFAGDALFTGLENDRVYPSYDRAGATIVDDYEESPPNPAQNRLGGAVTRSGNFLTFDVFEFRQGGSHVYNNTFFHDTDGLVTRWQKERLPSFLEEIPAAQADNSSFQYLSFRIAQVNDPMNDPSTTMNFSVGLEDSSGNRVDVDAASAGVIPFPYAHPAGGKSMMRTLRVPLACFALNGKGSVQLNRVNAIDFTMNKTVQGALAFDQIEFTH